VSVAVVLAFAAAHDGRLTSRRGWKYAEE